MRYLYVCPVGHQDTKTLPFNPIGDTVVCVKCAREGRTTLMRRLGELVSDNKLKMSDGKIRKVGRL